MNNQTQTQTTSTSEILSNFRFQLKKRYKDIIEQLDDTDNTDLYKDILSEELHRIESIIKLVKNK